MESSNERRDGELNELRKQLKDSDENKNDELKNTMKKLSKEKKDDLKKIEDTKEGKK